MESTPALLLGVRLLLLVPRLRPDDMARAINDNIIPALVRAGLWSAGVHRLFRHFDTYYYRRIGREALSVFGKVLNATTSPLEGSHHRFNEAQICKNPPFWCLYRKYRSVVPQCSFRLWNISVNQDFNSRQHQRRRAKRLGKNSQATYPAGTEAALQRFGAEASHNCRKGGWASGHRRRGLVPSAVVQSGRRGPPHDPATAVSILIVSSTILRPGLAQLWCYCSGTLRLISKPPVVYPTSSACSAGNLSHPSTIDGRPSKFLLNFNVFRPESRGA